MLYLHVKALFALGADHGVRSGLAGKAQDGLAVGTLAVDVSLAVTEFVSAELEEAAEPFVLASALGDVL